MSDSQVQEVGDGQAQPSATPEPATGLLGRLRRLALPVLLAGTFMAIMDTYIVNVAIPSIRAELPASMAQVELAVSGYVLAYGLMLVTGGRLGDAHGAKQMFLIGLSLFTAASLAAGLAVNAPMLIGSRVGQGLGAALFFPQVLLFLQTMYRDRAQARAFSLFAATIGLAAIAGQVIGGMLVQANLFGLQWRPIFLVNLLVGAVALAGAAVALPPTTHSGHARLDLPGVLLLGLAILLVTVPLLEGPAWGWPPGLVLLLVLAAPAFVLFVAWERRVVARGALPLVSPALFRRRGFTFGNAINLSFFAASTGLFFILTLHLQSGLGYSPLKAGLTFTILAVAFAIASLLAPRLQQRIGDHLLTTGYALNALGSLVLLLTAGFAGADLSPATLVPAFLVIGIGQGLGVTPLLGVILSGVPATDAGAASGVLETVGQIGMSMGVVVLGLIFSTALDSPLTAGGSAHAFSLALIGNVVLTAIAMVVTILLVGGGRRPATEPW